MGLDPKICHQEPLPVPRLPRPTQTVLPLLSARWRPAFGNNGWQLAALFFCILILMFGVGSGIENANKLMMPVFFILFVFLGIYVAFQPGAMQGYRYIFRIDPEILADPKTWIFALGQALFLPVRRRKWNLNLRFLPLR